MGKIARMPISLPLWSNPDQGSNGCGAVTNLTGSAYEIWIDDKGYSGTRPQRGTAINDNNTPNGQVDLWDSHVSIVLNSTSVLIYKTTYKPNPTGLRPTETLMATLSSPSACYNALGPSSLVQSMFDGTLKLFQHEQSRLLNHCPSKNKFCRLESIWKKTIIGGKKGPSLPSLRNTQTFVMVLM